MEAVGSSLSPTQVQGETNENLPLDRGKVLEECGTGNFYVIVFEKHRHPHGTQATKGIF